MRCSGARRFALHAQAFGQLITHQRIAQSGQHKSIGCFVHSALGTGLKFLRVQLCHKLVNCLDNRIKRILIAR